MPMREHTNITVTITVEVDGHILTFHETGSADGARYHGADPRDTGYATSDCFETEVRAAVTAGVVKANGRLQQLLHRAYPVAGDSEVPA